MDILIKNMEKPKNCEECLLATVLSYNTWCPLMECFIKRGYSFKDCPLVELPPHGRLGDLDKLYEVATAPYGNFYGFEALISDIKNAPTIIEASTEERKK